jgi:hypothetical protein
MSRVVIAILAWCLSLHAVAEPPASTTAGPAARKKVATWRLGQLQVLSPGAFKKLPEGRFTEGYTVTATARAEGDVPFPDGTFTMTIGSFTPAKDMPKQPTGSWYVKGAWRLVRTGSTVPPTARHSTESLQGQVVAKLPIDPTTGTGGWSATLRTPKGSAFGDLRNIAGTLTVNEKLEGTLFLQMEESSKGNSR